MFACAFDCIIFSYQKEKKKTENVDRQAEGFLRRIVAGGWIHCKDTAIVSNMNKFFYWNGKHENVYENTILKLISMIL